MNRLEGRTAIVTGGASGIGAASVRLFAEEGARVLIADVQEEQGNALAKELGDAGAYRKVDVTREADVLAAVDTQTEAAIMGKLQSVMNERTTLFVSHRISTLRYADTIIVIEDGRITQRGTHDELVRQPGYYSELNTLQRLEESLEADA